VLLIYQVTDEMSMCARFNIEIKQNNILINVDYHFLLGFTCLWYAISESGTDGQSEMRCQQFKSASLRKLNALLKEFGLCARLQIPAHGSIPFGTLFVKIK
jgi:hypothetical protein